MRWAKLQAAIEKFRDTVVEESKSNLKRLKKSATGELYNSIKGIINDSGDEMEVIFEMMDYGKFQDQGVDGKRVKHGSPFSYKQKPPPLSALDKWIVIRGLAPRDKKGRFMTRKQQQFALSRFIFNNGIKRSLFFTAPFEKAQKEAGKLFAIALTKDVSVYMEEIVSKSNRKRKK